MYSTSVGTIVVAPALIDKLPEPGDVQHADPHAAMLSPLPIEPRPWAGQPMILVFGSINVDVLVPVPRLPRPGETVLGGDYALLPGGKGANQALAARRAGAAVAMAGAVGEDAFAALALADLRGATASISAWCGAVGAADRLRRDHGRRGRREPDRGRPRRQSCRRGGRGARQRCSARGRCWSARWRCRRRRTAALIRRARAAGARIVLNLAPALPIDPALLDDIDLLVANRGEAASLGGDPAGLAAQLRQALVVTRGADGATAFLADGGAIAVPALPIDPVDTTGAGDTFVGVLAAGLDAGAGARAGAAPGQRRGGAGLPCAAARRPRCPTAPRSTRAVPLPMPLTRTIDANSMRSTAGMRSRRLNGDDQLGQPRPAATHSQASNSGCSVAEVDVGVLAGKAHREPFLALAAIAPAPQRRPAMLRPAAVVMQPARGFGEDLGLVGADLLLAARASPPRAASRRGRCRPAASARPPAPPACRCGGRQTPRPSRFSSMMPTPAR